VDRVNVSLLLFLDCLHFYFVPFVCVYVSLKNNEHEVREEELGIEKLVAKKTRRVGSKGEVIWFLYYAIMWLGFHYVPLLFIALYNICITCT